MKSKSGDFDREKRIHRVVKNADKTTKHRKSIYDFVEEDDEDIEDDFVYDTSEINDIRKIL